jgi:hypothetical protein
MKYVVYWDKVSRQYEVNKEGVLKMIGIVPGFIFDTGTKTYCMEKRENLNERLGSLIYNKEKRCSN